MRGWFSLDFLSTMPWSRIVDAFVGSDGGGALLHVAKLAKILGEIYVHRSCSNYPQIHAKGVPECLFFVCVVCVVPVALRSGENP